MRALIETELKANPLAAGRTPELSAKLLTNEKTIYQEPKQIVEVPYKAAECYVKKIPRQVVKHVKVGVEAYACWLTPWRWGNCWRDVFADVKETVYDDVTECVPEQLQVLKTVYTPIVKLNEKIFQASVWLNYSVGLDSLELSAVDNVIHARIKVDAPVSADVKAGLLGADVMVNGALSCSSQLAAEANATVILVEKEGNLFASTQVSDFGLDVNKLCVPGAVQLIDVLNKTNIDFVIITKVLERVLNQKIQDSINRSLAQGDDGFPLGKKLSTYVTKLRGVYEVGDQAWLTLEPRHASLSQLTSHATGNTQTINFTAGFDADVSVVYGTRPSLSSDAPVPVSLGSLGNQFRLAPKGVIELKKVQDVLLSEAIKFGGDKLRKAGFKISSIEIYQSDELLVFGVSIDGLNWMRPSGIIYLSGKPIYDSSKHAIAFKDFGFTMESRNWLLKNADALVHSNIEEYLSKELVFPIDNQLKKLLTRFENIEIPTQLGNLNGSLVNARLSSVWISNDALIFNLILEGTSQFTARLN